MSVCLYIRTSVCHTYISAYIPRTAYPIVMKLRMNILYHMLLRVFDSGHIYGIVYLFIHSSALLPFLHTIYLIIDQIVIKHWIGYSYSILFCTHCWYMSWSFTFSSYWYVCIWICNLGGGCMLLISLLQKSSN